MNKWLKKIGTGIVLSGLLFGAVACAPTLKLSDHQDIMTDVEAKHNQTVNVLDAQVANLTAQVEAGEAAQAELQAKLEEQQARDALVLEDARKALKEVEAELALLQSNAKNTAAESTADREVLDDIALGEAVGLVTLDNNDLAFLLDGEVRFDDEDYDVQEQIILKSSVAVHTSLEGDEELEEVPALVFEEDEAIEYKYVFDDDFDYTLVSNDEELIISMLGTEYRIVEVDANSITVLSGTEYVLAEGEEIVHDGKTIKVLTVSENDKVYVSVDGKSVVIDEEDSETVNGLDIRVDDVLYTGKETQKSFVTLTVSDDAERVIDSGDDFVEGDDTYEWVIETDGDLLKSIGLLLADKATDADEAVLRPGETLDFAGLFEVGFDLESDYDYKEFKLDLDDIHVDDEDIDVLRVRADGDYLIIGDEEVDEAFFDGEAVYYKDEDNDWVIDEENALVLENDDMSKEVSYDDGKILIGDIELDISESMKFFGELEEEAEAEDLIVDDKALGKRDEAVLLLDGTVIEAPEDDLDNDQLVLKLPDEEVEVFVTVGR